MNRQGTIRLSVLAVSTAIARWFGFLAVLVVAVGTAGTVRAQVVAQGDTIGAVDARRPGPLLEQRAGLDLEPVDLTTALKKLSRRAGVPLLFSPTLLPEGRQVSCRCLDVSVGTALDRLLTGSGFRYVEVAGQILIEARPTWENDVEAWLLQMEPGLFPASGSVLGPAKVRQGTVAGVVSAARDGQPLQGAQIVAENTGRGALTDERGRFRIEDLHGDEVTLRVVMLGYRTLVERVQIGDQDIRLALHETPVELEQLVVTGSMVETRARELPSPVTVITAEEIQRQGLASTEDILRTVPGMGVISNSGAEFHSRVYARGPSSLTSGFSSIKTYIDGVEVANPEWTLNQIDPASIERIEITRGPQASTLYGSGAIAGVMQILTKKGRSNLGRPMVDVQLSGGGLQSPYRDGAALVQDHRLSVTGGEERFSYNVGGAFTSTGEWVEDELRTEEMPPNSANDTRSAHAGVKYAAGTLVAEASARLYAGDFGAPHPKAITDRVRSGEWNAVALPEYTVPNGSELDLGERTFGLTMRYGATARWQHQLAVGYDRMVNEYRRPQPRLTTPADTFLSFSRSDEDKVSLTYNTALEVPLGGSVQTTLVAGYDWWAHAENVASISHARRLEGSLGTQGAQVTRTRVDNHGFFLQAQTGWRDRLFLTAGVRGDNNSAFGDDYGTAWAPRVGLAYVLEMGRVSMKSRAAWGKALRPPEPTQRAGPAPSSHETYLPNLEIGPESQTGYDVGAELYIGSRFSLGATYYDQEAEDLISLVRLNDFSEVPAVGQYQNVGRIHNTGWELEGSVTLGLFLLRAQLSLLESTIEELSPTYTGTEYAVGESPWLVPTSTGEVSVTYADNRTSVTLAMSHTGSRTGVHFLDLYNALAGTDPDRAPYTGNVRDYVADFSSLQRYQLTASQRISERITAFLNVDNLLDNKEPELSDISLIQGRRSVLGLKWRPFRP